MKRQARAVVEIAGCNDAKVESGDGSGDGMGKREDPPTERDSVFGRRPDPVANSSRHEFMMSVSFAAASALIFPSYVLVSS
jgi:hypothetical protein